MKRILVLAAIILLGVVGVHSPRLSTAHTSGPAVRFYCPPPRGNAPRVPLIPRWITPWRILAPNPNWEREWDAYRRWLDLQQLIRSPLNPESTIDYMMRTF